MTQSPTLGFQVEDYLSWQAYVTWAAGAMATPWAAGAVDTATAGAMATP